MPKLAVDMRKQCVAKTLASTYSQSHRCLKQGRLIEKNIHLCAHHSEMPLRNIFDQKTFRLSGRKDSA